MYVCSKKERKYTKNKYQERCEIDRRKKSREEDKQTVLSQTME